MTLVGPFRVGKVEGPCKSFPFEAQDELDRALGEFLEQFVERFAHARGILRSRQRGFGVCADARERCAQIVRDVVGHFAHSR